MGSKFLRWCGTPAATAGAGSTLPPPVIDPNVITPLSATVSKWLFGSCAVVGGIVVVGGVTRLTESGLSIVDWKPIRGIIPPITREQWDEEFTKYQAYPEYKQKPEMTLQEFQFIFFWEWFHRVLARSMGVVYGVPLVYFIGRGYFNKQPAFAVKLTGCLALGGCQGALGWYMVKSGLDPKLLDERQKATVSAYRLAAHLTLAFTIYSSMLKLAFSLRVPKVPVPVPGIRNIVRLTTATMFVTAISGAFVAGLDAGLLYCDTFPLMGKGIFPDPDDVFVLFPPWRNLFENGTAAQLWHRLMAGTTTYFVLCINYFVSRAKYPVPPAFRKALRGVNHALAFQVLLGFATLMSYVATPIAVLHQANSLALLTMLIRLLATLGTKGRINL